MRIYFIKFDYICGYCKCFGLPSIFVFIDSVKKYGLCTACANKMRANKMRTDKMFIVLGNEIRMKE